MTTVNAVAMKNVGYPLPGREEVVLVRFSFAAEAGVAQTYNLFKALQDLIVLEMHMVVKAAVTSGGSATVAAGITGTTNKFWGTATGAKANLTLGALILPDVVEGTPNAIACPLLITATNYATLTIGTADLTAGIMDFAFRIARP